MTYALTSSTKLINLTIEHCWQQIPVNASTWATATLLASDFTRTSTIDNNYTTIVFLRDPIDRWLSGVAQCICGKYPQYTSLEGIRDHSLLLDLIFTYIQLDVHTGLQTDFLKELNLSQTKFFMVNDSLSASVGEYFKQTANLILPDLPRENAGTLNSGKLIPKQYFKSVLESNPIYLRNVKRFFYSDYRFIQTQQFENVANTKFMYYDF